MNFRMLMLFIIAVFVALIKAEELTIEKAIQMALENNKDILVAREEIKRADARVKEAWSSALPSVNVLADYSRNFKQTFFYVNGGDFGRFSFTFNNEYRLNAVLNQTIYSFGKVGTALKIARDYEKFSSAQFTNQKQQIITMVKRAFYGALLKKHIYQVSKDSEQSARENYQNTKQRYESGTVSEFDLLQAEVRWQNAIPDTIQARNEWHLALNNLKSMLSLPLENSITLVGEFSENLLVTPEESYEQVLQQRPDYQMMRWEMAMRKKNISLQFAQHFPSLNGSFTYSYSALSDQFKLENTNDNYVLGVSLSVPIFSGGFTTAQVQQARVDYNQSAIRLKKQEEQIRIELENVRLRLKEAQQRILAAKKNVSTAQRAYEIAEVRNKSGLATQLELKDSRVFLDQARLSYYRALFDELNAYFDWQLITGQQAENLN